MQETPKTRGKPILQNFTFFHKCLKLGFLSQFCSLVRTSLLKNYTIIEDFHTSFVFSEIIELVFQNMFVSQLLETHHGVGTFWEWGAQVVGHSEKWDCIYKNSCSQPLASLYVNFIFQHTDDKHNYSVFSMCPLTSFFHSSVKLLQSGAKFYFSNFYIFSFFFFFFH